MDKDQWFGFIAAGGRLSLADWVSLSEEDRDAAAEAGAEYRDDIIGNIAKAIQNPLHAFHLLGDKEAIDDALTDKFFEAYQVAQSLAVNPGGL